jgi:hypothetical protein
VADVEVTDLPAVGGGQMNRGDSANDSRKPYEPPALMVISLRPEEAVLGNCKNAGGTGPMGGGANPCEILQGGCTPLGS